MIFLTQLSRFHNIHYALKPPVHIISAMEVHQVRCMLASSYFCLAFLYLGVISASGFIADIYQDHTIEFENETLVINHTVHVHENATLTIQPGVNIIFTGNGSFTVHGNLVANGTETLPIDLASFRVNAFAFTISFGLRIVDGNGYNTGRLEIFHDGIWGTVCDDGWTQVNSIVACRELGFSTGSFTREFPRGSGQIWLDDVRCSLNDPLLRLCEHRGFGSHNCGRFYYSN